MSPSSAVASGLAAAVFAARYGLETLVFDRGGSAIKQSHSIENSLGFLAIDPATFLWIDWEHARYEGTEIVDDHIATVSEANEGNGRFRVRTEGGTKVRARYAVAASAYKAGYLTGLDDGAFHDDGKYPVDCDEAIGTRVSTASLSLAVSPAPRTRCSPPQATAPVSLNRSYAIVGLSADTGRGRGLPGLVGRNRNVRRREVARTRRRVDRSTLCASPSPV